jgi:hypothetical protein
MFKRPSSFKHGSHGMAKPCMVSSGVAYDIICNMNKPIKTFVPDTFVPIADYKGYANMLLKRGENPERVATIYKKCEDELEKYKKPSLVKKVREYRTEPIVPVGLVMKVNEQKGKVSVKLDCLSLVICENYFSKGKQPPIGEYIRALARRGYPEEKCLKVLDKQTWLKEHEEELDAEIERRWPSSKGKKAVQIKKVLKAVKKV